MPGCEGGVVIESKDFTVWAECPCGWKGRSHAGPADSAHDDALADRAAHLAGLPTDPPPSVEAGHDHPIRRTPLDWAATTWDEVAP